MGGAPGQFFKQLRVAVDCHGKNDSIPFPQSLSITLRELLDQVVCSQRVAEAGQGTLTCGGAQHLSHGAGKTTLHSGSTSFTPPLVVCNRIKHSTRRRAPYRHA